MGCFKVFDKLQIRNFSFLTYFLLVQTKVDKTKMIINILENIDNINDNTNLVLASDVIETKVEAFKEDDAIAAQETDQESFKYGNDLPWIRRSLWSKRTF